MYKYMNEHVHGDTGTALTALSSSALCTGARGRAAMTWAGARTQCAISAPLALLCDGAAFCLKYSLAFHFRDRAALYARPYYRSLCTRQHSTALRDLGDSSLVKKKNTLAPIVRNS